MSTPQPNGTGMSRAVFFPDEVIVQVLSLLNVKSLMQLKCVCKSWNLLISDPTFIKLHLKRSARNPHIAIMNSHRPWSITTFPVRSLFENTSITLSENPNPYFHNNRGHVYLVGSCNGLLCFVSYFSTIRSTEVLLYLWNPATRTISNKIVFVPDEDDKSDEYRLRHWYFAFGYDNSTNTYKIVAFRGNNVRIFNVGEDNVWRNIQSFLVVHLDIDLSYVYNLAINCGIYVSGTINWFTIPSNSEHHQFVIISLDLSTEAYRQLKPPPVFDEGPIREPVLALLMDSLCFSHYLNGTHFIIWQMKEYGVEDSWTQILKFSYQILSIDYQVLFPLCLSENDDILILTMPQDDNEPAFLYNFRDNRVEQKTRITNPMEWWYLAKYYVESLVSPS